MNVITIPAYRRPYHLSKMIVTLLDNALGSWSIHIAIEPSPYASDMARMAAGLLAKCENFQIDINEQRLGVIHNPRRLIENAFQKGAELVLHLEEDLLVAPDATALAQWFQRNHQPDWLCLNLLSGSCGSAGMISNPDFPHILFPSKTFNALGFAVRREEWGQHMHPAWLHAEQAIVGLNGVPTGGWDWAVAAALMRDPSLVSVQPALARANHNGRTGGEHCSPSFHDLAFSDLPIFSGESFEPSFTFQSHAQLPGGVRRHVQLWVEMVRAWRVLDTQYQSEQSRHD